MMIAMTGVSGNMGQGALRQTLEIAAVERVRVLLRDKRCNRSLANRYKKRYGHRVEVVFGDVSERRDCDLLVKGANYVVHMAAVIPPKSDADPAESERCNYRGAVSLTDAILAMPVQAKYIHVSSIALYGCRNEKHPFCRVGDPLVISPFDMYALHKLAGERYVLEAGLKSWIVLRQTAMLHPNMLHDNMSDGLMFHTCLNAPLEWVSARDSGYLIRRILERDMADELAGFWRRVYNLGGGYHGRQTGYDTFRVGFAVMGGNTEKFFRPNWLAARNFHGVWIADADVLEELFHYQREGVEEIWADIARRHRIYKLAKLVPPGLIVAFFFKRLLAHPNSPMRWRKNGDGARVYACYGGEEGFAAIPAKWEEVKLLSKGDFGDYAALRREANAALLSHGFDDSRAPELWTLDDCKSAAAFRGGACLSDAFSGPYVPLRWRCHDGHEFLATPYTVMGAGHWCPECAPRPWDFDRQAKHNPFYAQVWYDTHAEDENVVYDMDGENAVLRPLEEV